MSRISEYRHRMTVQSYTTSVASTGARTKNWSTLISMWASLEGAYKGEEIIGGTSSESIHPIQVAYSFFWIKTRYRAGVSFSPKNRIVFGSRVFDIISVGDQTGRKEEIAFLCREAQA